LKIGFWEAQEADSGSQKNKLLEIVKKPLFEIQEACFLASREHAQSRCFGSRQRKQCHVSQEKVIYSG